jgi:hypothetical protein
MQHGGRHGPGRDASVLSSVVIMAIVTTIAMPIGVRLLLPSSGKRKG